MAERKGSSAAKYEPRAQFVGVLRVLCPFCGTIAQHRIAPAVYKIRCRNDECQRELLIGFRFLVPSRVRVDRSKPRLPVDVVFPESELGEWSPGDRVHAMADT
jgi:hypothetical protein